MKNVIASILLIITLLFSFFLYRLGNIYQASLTQEPMSSPARPSAEARQQEEAPLAKDVSEEEAAGQEAVTGEADGQAEEPQKEEIPSRSEDLARLQDILSERLAGSRGEWALYVRYLPTGEGFALDSRPMVAASLIKLFVAGAYLEAVEAGEVQDQYDAALKSMLSQSDNDAANSLINLLGMDRINTFIQDHGFEDTKLDRLMLAFNGMENYTSVNDCGALLDQVYRGTFVSREASDRILSSMKEQKVRTKIPGGLPEGTECANKTGELANVENDTAIIFAPGGDYIFCVMSEQVSAGTAHEDIKEMSRIIYESLGAENDAAGAGV